MVKKKLGFSLSGGGARGVAHVGFLQAMEENDIAPDVISGCSMGAIVGGAYSAGVKLSALKKCLTSLTQKDLLDFNFNFLRARSIFTSKKMQCLLKKYVGEKNIEDLDISFGCIAVDLITGKIIELTDGDLSCALRASSAIPTVFEPVEKNGRLLVDGGVLLRNPVNLCKRLGADVVIGVDVIGKLNDAEKYDKLLDVGSRTFSIIDDIYCSKRGVKNADLMLYPKMRGVSLFKFENLNIAYKSGYEAGIENVDKIKKLIA